MSWTRPRSLERMDAAEADAAAATARLAPRLLSDEWDAMREVHEILRHYDEAARRRIQEAVNARLGDDAARAAHQD